LNYMDKKISILLFFLFSAVAVLFALFTGAAGWGPGSSYIMWNIRVPRVAAAFVAGAGLGASGALLQAILKNPLAAPYVAGTSAGAGLGVALAAVTGLTVLETPAGFAGGLIVTGIVFKMASYSKRKTPESLVLAGVVMSSLVSAVTFMIMVFNRDTVFRILFFQTGSFQFVSQRALFFSAVLITAGIVFSLLYARELDVMTQGDDVAVSLGVEISKTRKVLFAVSALMVSGSVAVAGVVGFVGLIVPHVVRFILGATHRRLILLSAVFGGGFLVFTDALARGLFAPMEIPAGIITAFFGAPFFLYLLIKG